MVVGFKVNILVAVLGEIVVCVDGSHVALHCRVASLDVLSLRGGVGLLLHTSGQAHFGVVGNHQAVNIEAVELIGEGVDAFAVVLTHGFTAAEQLKAGIVPNIDRACVIACSIIVGRICRDKHARRKLVGVVCLLLCAGSRY